MGGVNKEQHYLFSYSMVLCGTNQINWLKRNCPGWSIMLSRSVHPPCWASTVMSSSSPSCLKSALGPIPNLPLPWLQGITALFGLQVYAQVQWSADWWKDFCGDRPCSTLVGGAAKHKGECLVFIHSYCLTYKSPSFVSLLSVSLTKI